MSRDAHYQQEIKKAKTNLADFHERGADAIGEDALEFMREILTPEEIAASDLVVMSLKRHSKLKDDLELKLDEADSEAAVSNVRYAHDEVFSRLKAGLNK